MIGLGLDAGGSATRWVLADAAGSILVRGTGAPISGLLFDAATKVRAAAAVQALAVAVLAAARPGAVLAGVTGTDAQSPAAVAIATLLAQAFALPEKCVRVIDDLWIAHQARFAPGTGILVYAGTGSAACHVTAEGTAVRAGGRGHLIDDAGSGYAIARDALRAVLRREDEAPGAGWASPLGQALAGAIGGSAWSAVRTHIYGGDHAGTRARMAALAPAVAAAAEAGDAQADAVLAEAGADLARLAAALRARVGPQPVALAGRAALLHPRIRAAMEQVLGVPADSTPADAAAAAARIAAGQTPCCSGTPTEQR